MCMHEIERAMQMKGEARFSGALSRRKSVPF